MKKRKQIQYEKAKRKIKQKDLSPVEYEKAIQRLCRKLRM